MDGVCEQHQELRDSLIRIEEGQKHMHEDLRFYRKEVVAVHAKQHTLEVSVAKLGSGVRRDRRWLFGLGGALVGLVAAVVSAWARRGT